MLTNFKRKIEESYRKNKDDIRSLLTGIYPSFVYKNLNSLEEGKIPVFVFHSVEPQKFESQLKFLSENGYTTINSEKFYGIITGKIPFEKNQIVLTFDDGLSSLWSVAFPLLKKYGMCAVSFIVPNLIKDEFIEPTNLEDVWLGRSNYDDIQARNNYAPLCTWDEIFEMHKSGIVDFQSHSLNHASVFVSDEIIDFVNPDFQPNFLNGSFQPKLFQDFENCMPEFYHLGMPVFKSAPELSAKHRFIENKIVSESCIEFVKQNGGLKFFKDKNWRKRLLNLTEIQKKNFELGKFQSFDERMNEIFIDLKTSKELIENLLGKQVNHLCYPWYAANEHSVFASQQAGYISNYWGIVNKKSLNDISTNPFYISRITDDYIFTLPGKGRRSLHEIIAEKFLNIKDNN